METEREDLEPADMLSLVQLLVAAAEVPVATATESNRSVADALKLSQHFISVADGLIGQDNALKWQAIKEVGPRPRPLAPALNRTTSHSFCMRSGSVGWSHKSDFKSYIYIYLFVSDPGLLDQRLSVGYPSLVTFWPQ